MFLLWELLDMLSLVWYDTMLFSNQQNQSNFYINCVYIYIYIYTVYIRGVTIRVFVLNRSVWGFRFGTHYKPNDSLD